MALSLEKYGTGAYPFPKDEINPTLKNEVWGKNWCQALYAAWRHGSTSIPFSQISEFRSLRRLADGKQDVLQYQKLLLDESDENSAMKGYMNLNWDIFSVMPKFLRVVEGMMEQTDHQVVATAVDPTSTEEKEDAKLNMEYRMKFKEALQYIDKGLGIDRSDEYIPESMEEINLFEGAGGFKLAKEIEIEQGLDYTFYISEWRETKKKVIRDLCVINCAGTKDFTDPYTKKVKTRYVDPELFIGQYSKHWDHNNMSYGGEIIQVPIGDIRKLNIPGVEENELIELARQYTGVGNNISCDNPQYDEDSKTGNYDSMLVDVLDAEWKSVNGEYKTSRKNQYGPEIIYDEQWGKVFNTEKRKTTKYDIQTVYKCKWIIGTDHVYDFGLQYDIPRPGQKEVELSFHLYKLPYRSLVSLSESHLHQIALTFFKLQNAIAMASPPGIAIEYTAIQNMTLGSNKLQPLELLKIKTQTGNLIYKATTHKGNPNTPGAYRPIQELQGGIGSQLQEFITIFEFNMNAIRENTGINQIADASNPNPEMSVGGSEIAMAATNNALRPIYSAYLHLKEQTAKNISLRMQLLIKHDGEAYKGYIPVIGSIGVKVISVGADTVDANYYIKYEAKPTEKRKDIIKQAAITAMSPDRDGVIGIELADYLMIERLLEGGNLKYAEAMLNYKSKKNKERQQKLQRENMTLDKQREQEAIQLKSQLNFQDIKNKTDEEIRLYEAKKAIDEKYAQPQHQREMQKIGVQSSLGIVQDAAKQEVASQVTTSV
jgi:hypothetical protein